MEFQGRSTQPMNVAPAPVAVVKKTARGRNLPKISFVSLAVVIAVLLIALIAFMAFGANGASEKKYVDTTKYQAVFLQTGQVYFGKINDLNANRVVLTNIYYLQTSSTGTAATSTNSSVSLVKLGCELHQPYDQMIINRSQVTFWENLQDNGQVAKAVASFVKANPNGQKCTDASTTGTTTDTVQHAPTKN
jgi:hypothetical protein